MEGNKQIHHGRFIDDHTFVDANGNIYDLQKSSIDDIDDLFGDSSSGDSSNSPQGQSEPDQAAGGQSRGASQADNQSQGDADSGDSSQGDGQSSGQSQGEGA